MFTKLDADAEQLLCCSVCKSHLVKEPKAFVCQSCGLRFPAVQVSTGSGTRESVFDFRIHRPSYCVPEGQLRWHEAQREFEKYQENSAGRDSLEEYRAEIDIVREIYNQEYHLSGTVLDVGGHQGRLRHFLGDDVRLYISIDPYIDIFADIPRQPNLQRAFPCLAEPCNFIAASSEYLPFRSQSFDWVHMRSVVDHFADPYVAFLEAYRCTKDGGKLLVGLSITERKEELDQMRRDRNLRRRTARKMKLDGFFRATSHLTNQLTGRGRDDHMFRLTQADLVDLFEQTGWDVIKQHWTKPPYSYCSYTCGQARSSLRAVA